MSIFALSSLYNKVMHNTKHNILHTKLLLLLLLLVSCGSKDNGNSADIEQQGQQWLNKARTALSDSNYALARQCIDSLRTRSAEAFNAREEGILLLDSIELAEARVELAAAEQAASVQGLDIYARDSVDTNLDRAQTKVRFYERKLDHDRQQP